MLTSFNVTKNNIFNLVSYTVISLFPVVCYSASSAEISPLSYTVERFPTSYTLATGTFVADGVSAVVQLITGPPRCKQGTTPYITLAVLGTKQPAANLSALYIYPINPYGCWATNKTKGPICDSVHPTWGGTRVAAHAGGGYFVYFRNEAQLNGVWAAGWADVNWTIYCFNNTEYTSYVSTTGYSANP